MPVIAVSVRWLVEQDVITAAGDARDTYGVSRLVMLRHRANARRWYRGLPLSDDCAQLAVL